MSSRRRISDDDAALFHSVMGDVRRLEDNRVERPKPRPPARPRSQPVAQAVSDALMPDGIDDAAPGFGERQAFARDGVQRKLLRRLARGNVPVEDSLDLHGLRVADARHALAGFLEQCERRGLRCVRIVTGKGFGSRGTEPVLKAQVDRWLRLRPQVLAFCSAPPRDGGTGAVSVLLGREKGPRSGT